MWAVGPTTVTRATRPARSMSWATFRPKVVLPAAGVAEARKLAPSWSRSARSAAFCQARRGRAAGHSGTPTRDGDGDWTVIGGGPRYVGVRSEYLGREPPPHPRPGRRAGARRRVRGGA